MCCDEVTLAAWHPNVKTRQLFNVAWIHRRMQWARAFTRLGARCCTLLHLCPRVHCLGTGVAICCPAVRDFVSHDVWECGATPIRVAIVSGPDSSTQGCREPLWRGRSRRRKPLRKAARLFASFVASCLGRRPLLTQHEHGSYQWRKTILSRATLHLFHVSLMVSFAFEERGRLVGTVMALH
jgi:hypothetical protein